MISRLILGNEVGGGEETIIIISWVYVWPVHFEESRKESKITIYSGCKTDH